MTLKNFTLLRKATHVLLFCAGLFFTVLLFMQFGNDVVSKVAFSLFGATTEFVKIYLLIKAKILFGEKGWAKAYALMYLLVYLCFAFLSGVATTGFALNSISNQSFNAGLSNINVITDQQTLSELNAEINTILKQQSELDPTWVTATQRYSEDLERLKAEREIVSERLSAYSGVQSVSSDTFTLLGQLDFVKRSGYEVLLFLYIMLSILLEFVIALTSGTVETVKKKSEEDMEEQMAGFLPEPIEKEKALPRLRKDKRASGCESCLAYQHCKSPKMPVLGEGGKKILIIFNASTEQEDKKNSPFNNPEHHYLFDKLEGLGIASKDVWVTHAVQCYQKDKVTPQAIAGCHTRLMATINRLQPEKIIVCGEIAMKTLYNHVSSGRFSFAKYHKFPGAIIPDQEFKCLVIPVEDPKEAIDELQRRKDGILKYKPEAKFNEILWNDDWLAKTDSFRIIDRLLKNQLRAGLKAKYTEYDFGNIRTVYNEEDIIKVLEYFLQIDMFAFDIETNGLKPYADHMKIYSWSFSDGTNTYAFLHSESPKIIRLLRKLMIGPAKKLGWNMQYEFVWIKKKLGVEINNFYWDGMIGAHIINNREGITSLKFQTFVQHGIAGYDSEIDSFLKSSENTGNSTNNIDKAPKEKILRYGGMDSKLTYSLCKEQMNTILNHPVLKKGYRLFHDGQITLAKMSYQGFLVDMITLEKNIRDLEVKEHELYNLIKQAPEVKNWHDFNPRSDRNLIELFYEKFGFPIVETTKTGAPSVNGEVLEGFAEVHKCGIAKHIADYKKILQTKDTFLQGIKSETWDNEIHPLFSLNLVSSYRSSSQAPNFQNHPKRDEEVSALIRSVLKPRPGHVFLDVDYVSLEGFMGCNYHRDTMMQTYLLNEDTDMHKDMAEDLFMCKKDQVSEELFKAMRRVGKTANFALQYGSSARMLGINLWNGHMTKELKAFVYEKGILSLDHWQKHTREIYRIYWEERFVELKKWRDSVWQQYIETGEVVSHMGFLYTSKMTQNQAGNFQVQGSGFNALMTGINYLTTEIEKKKMKSRFVAEIHDSIILEVPEEEIESIKSMIKDCFIDRIKSENPWMIMPLRMSGEVYRENWAEHDKSENFTLTMDEVA